MQLSVAYLIHPCPPQVSGAGQGSTTVRAPERGGQYHFRYFLVDGQPMGVSEAVTVRLSPEDEARQALELEIDPAGKAGPTPQGSPVQRDLGSAAWAAESKSPEASTDALDFLKEVDPESQGGASYFVTTGKKTDFQSQVEDTESAKANVVETPAAPKSYKQPLLSRGTKSAKSLRSEGRRLKSGGFSSRRGPLTLGAGASSTKSGQWANSSIVKSVPGRSLKRVGALGAGRTKMKMEEGGSSSMRIDSELADRLHTNDASMSCNLNALESKLDALLAASSESPPSSHQDGGNLAQSPVPFHLEETPKKAPPAAPQASVSTSTPSAAPLSVPADGLGLLSPAAGHMLNHPRTQP